METIHKPVMGRQKNHIYESLNGCIIEKAVDTLIEEIANIRSVEDWSNHINLSYEWLKKWTKKYFGKSPGVIVREVRYDTIILLIMENGWESKSIYIAYKSGLGSNSDSLYKFLKSHYNTTFTRLKKEVLSKEFEVDFVWLTKVENKDFYQIPKIAINITKSAL